MAQIEKPAIQAFRVELTEHELGWGSKLWDTLHFDNESEARQYAKDYNAKNNNAIRVPDWYVVAEYAGQVK